MFGWGSASLLPSNKKKDKTIVEVRRTYETLYSFHYPKKKTTAIFVGSKRRKEEKLKTHF